LGFDPLDVRWVIMTHMHGDHAGGIGHFTNSEILLSKPEADAALARTGRCSAISTCTIRIG
jgi:N-acyl homoserine lactone hydrolase